MSPHERTAMSTRFLVVLALALLILAGVFAANADAATPPRLDGWERNLVSRSADRSEAPKTYTVKRGDTLDEIARKHDVPGGFERLHYVNRGRISNADVIEVGMTLTLPKSNGKVIKYTPPAPEVTSWPSSSSDGSSSAPSSQPSQPDTSSSVSGSAPSGSVWHALAQCESGGNWSINTGNGYYGGLQFSLSSWQAVGGSGLPSDASVSEQIMRGQRLQAIQGWGAWPACSAKLGL